ncbi:DUF2950 domain-containing protein [Noviherbaspirillum pedocola]|uniref:DUF2950 domain-containing protein n=1 Tax=Noviherbaspirillum pedocola TaxID=2801341 RepID=A0A934SRZ8_9BURK|nr:DUF2950 domain-containing protein [Noviherbaspirillum pedocola]MBK4734405.1 DUF2950 domain-containing protein [Noviherbaspirillum pedocola]
MDARRGSDNAKRKGWRGIVALCACIALLAHAVDAQRNFASPQEAAQALIKVAKANDRDAVLSILGPDAAEWMSSGDETADRQAVARFVAHYETQHAIELHEGSADLVIGSERFPFAFPLVREQGRWRFDTAAGKEEMLRRRIGENELSTIRVLRAIVAAQQEYAAEDRNGDGLRAYAQKFASSPGRHDGLYWPTQPGDTPSPLGELVAQASSEGYERKGEGPSPYHGYFYRMLQGQGSHAVSGAYDYAVKGRAIGGFAVIAYPARYGNSGIMSFIVNQDGKIYQADLGPETQERALQTQRFDPGPGWLETHVR